ncbi:MAG TPA: prolipoprotein diacylglyceryl transferase family protein [Candidatus Limnocylindrales bacterium]
MLPVLVVGPLRLATHDVFTVVGLLAGLVLYYRALARRGLLERRIVWLSLVAIGGGAIGARLITAWEHIPYYRLLGEAPLTYVVEHSGKSIIGAIAGGYLAVVVGKRLLRYQRSTGDCYALAIPVATAIGRVGCFLSELPLGMPTDLPWGVRVSPAAAAAFPYCPGCSGPMHPSMVYEIGFCLLAAGLIVRYGGRVPVQGDLLKLYLLAGGLFRFLVEFVRGNPPQALGLSGPQWVLLPLLGLLALHFARQWRRGLYRVPAAPPAESSPPARPPTAGPGPTRAAEDAGLPVMEGGLP